MRITGNLVLSRGFWSALIDRIENLYEEVTAAGTEQPPNIEPPLRLPEGAFRFKAPFLNRIIRRIESMSDWIYATDYDNGGSGDPESNN